MAEQYLALSCEKLYTIVLLLNIQLIDHITQAENKVTRLEKSLQKNNKRLLNLEKYIKPNRRYTIINNVIYPNLN